MKNFKLIFPLVVLCVFGSIFSAEAQTRAARTSSARAYYGDSPDKPKLAKKKKQKVKNYTHTRPAKGTQADAWSTRKKYQRS